MTSLPSTNYIPIDDVGSEESDLSAPKPNNRWKLLSFLLSIGLLASLINILNLTRLAANPQEVDPDSTNTISSIQKSMNSSSSENYKNLLTSYLWPNGKYLLYSVQNPENYNLTIYAETKDLVPQTIELIQLDAFAGQIIGIIGSRTQDINSKFVLRIHYGDTVRFYLVGVNYDESIKKLQAITPLELNFDTNLLDLDNYLYYFDVLAWVDNDRIIVEQTDALRNNPDDITVKYWVAPVTNLNLKTDLKFN